MENSYMEPELSGVNPKNVILGLLIGGLIGATAMLFFAPQSGKFTRALLQRKSSEALGRTTEIGKKAIAQFESIPAKLRQATSKLSG